MGTTGYKQLMEERKENYKILKQEMTKIAEKYGERVLETKNNPVSIGEWLQFLSHFFLHHYPGHLGSWRYQISFQGRNFVHLEEIWNKILEI